MSEKSAKEGGADNVNNTLTNVENSVNDVDKLINQQKDQIQDLQEKLDQNKILQDQSEEQRKALANSLNEQIQVLDLLVKDWKDYKGNVHAIAAEAKAKKYLPWGYALVAVVLFKKNTWQDKALVGLAGYGTGSLIEQSGWGIAHFGVKTLFRLGYSF